MQSHGSTDDKCQTTEYTAACTSLPRPDMGRYYGDPTYHGVVKIHEIFKVYFK